MKNKVQAQIESKTEEAQGILQEMIQDLQNILQHEKKHFNFYLHASLEVSGLERLYLKPLFEKEMEGELKHIRQFGDKIVALGGVPTHNAHPFSFDNRLDRHPSARSLLEGAVKMEAEVLRVYHQLYPKAEKFAEIYNDMSIVLLLEENIEHTTADLEEMEKLLN